MKTLDSNSIETKKVNHEKMIMICQIALIGIQSSVPYKLNPFMVEKLNTEMPPFSDYDF